MRNDQDNTPVRPHAINVQHRLSAQLTGVEDVLSFNEEMILLMTAEGALSIGGSNLHIGALNLSEGTLQIEGNISALAYDDSVRDRRRSLFGRLFK